MTSGYDNSERYRYANQITAGMWVNTFRGWRRVDTVSVDQIRWVTFVYTDGSASAHAAKDLLQARES